MNEVKLHCSDPQIFSHYYFQNKNIIFVQLLKWKHMLTNVVEFITYMVNDAKWGSRQTLTLWLVRNRDMYLSINRSREWKFVNFLCPFFTSLSYSCVLVTSSRFSSLPPILELVKSNLTFLLLAIWLQKEWFYRHRSHKVVYPFSPKKYIPNLFSTFYKRK